MSSTGVRQPAKSVREWAERMWQADPTLSGLVPVHMAAPETELEVLEPGLAFIMTFANVSVVDTLDGPVLIDTGSFHKGQHILNGLAKFSNKPVHSAIYTHGHVDHCMGIREIEKVYTERGWPKVRVIGHELLNARFDRYKLTLGRNAAINGRQFRIKPEFPQVYRYPDLTYNTETITLTIGDVVLELHHDKGETDDSTWVWIPKHKAICTGDLFIWAAPNCGNPQKAQRYPLEWARGLRKMLKLDAEYLLPGHGPPVIGRQRVQQALTDTAVFLESICEQTLQGINAGWSLEKVLHSVKVPEELLQKPYLKPVYDDPHFIVHNLWRLYGGWWTQDITQLRQVNTVDFAKEVVALIDDRNRLHQRVEKLLEEGNSILALSLIEVACRAWPDDKPFQELRVKVLKRRESQETSLMAKSIYRAERNESEDLIKKLTNKL